MPDIKLEIAPLKKGIRVPNDRDAALHILMPYFPRYYILPALLVETIAAGFGYMFGRGVGALSASAFETAGMFEPHSLDYLPALSAWIGVPVCMGAVLLAYHIVRQHFRRLLRATLTDQDGRS